MDELCTACLCTGRNLFYIGNTDIYHIYWQILHEMPAYDTNEIIVRVCWECKAKMSRWLMFKDQVKQAYRSIITYHINENILHTMPHEPALKVHSLAPWSYPLDIKEEPPSEDEHNEPDTFVHQLDPIDEKPQKEKTKRKLKTKAKVKKKSKKQMVKHKLEETRDDVDNDEGISDRETDTFNYDNELPVNGDSIPEGDKSLDIPSDDKLIQAPEPVKAKTPKTKLALNEKPQCVECGKVFSSRKTYRYHLNVLHQGQNRYPCPRCGKVYQWKSNLGRHLRSHKAKDSGELYCEMCDKRFASVATYRQHLKVSRKHVAESDFSFKCTQCDKKFVNKTRLRDHVDWEHLHNIKFRCQLCDKPFKCHTSLYVHLQNVHRNKEKKDNLCHICGKSYQNAAKLRYHIVAMHTAETPYRCAQCGASFGWYSSLYRHVREVHYKMKVEPKKSKKGKKKSDVPLPPAAAPPPPH